MIELAITLFVTGAVLLTWDALRRDAMPDRHDAADVQTEILARRAAYRCHRESLWTQPANKVPQIQRACEALVKGTQTLDYPGRTSMNTYYTSSAGRGRTAIFFLACKGEDRSALYGVSARDYLRTLHREPHRYKRLGGDRT
jgi:hypothetical protein